MMLSSEPLDEPRGVKVRLWDKLPTLSRQLGRPIGQKSRFPAWSERVRRGNATRALTSLRISHTFILVPHYQSSIYPYTCIHSTLYRSTTRPVNAFLVCQRPLHSKQSEIEQAERDEQIGNTFRHGGMYLLTIHSACSETDIQ